MLGFKSEEAGLSRAKAGVMRRLSMVALRATARQVLRGLAIVGPPCIHQHNAREAARRAHLDAFGADRGAPWRNPTNGRGQQPPVSTRGACCRALPPSTPSNPACDGPTYCICSRIT